MSETRAVAWTTQAQLDKFKIEPGCNAVMWGEPLPHHPDIPLYASRSIAAAVGEARRIIGDLVGHARFVDANFDISYAHLHEAESYLANYSGLGDDNCG